MNAGEALKAFAEDCQKDLDALDYHCREIARIMTDWYGGNWDWDINHNTHFVLISREIEAAS